MTIDPAAISDLYPESSHRIHISLIHLCGHRIRLEELQFLFNRPARHAMRNQCSRPIESMIIIERIEPVELGPRLKLALSQRPVEFFERFAKREREDVPEPSFVTRSETFFSCSPNPLTAMIAVVI